jgi:spore coat protein SA
MIIAIISPGPFSVPPVKGSSVEHDIDQVSQMFGPEHQVIIYTRTCKKYPRSSAEGNREFVRLRYNGPGPYLQGVIRNLRKREPDVILVENRPHYVFSLRKHFPQKPIIVNMHSHVYASRPVISPEKMQRAIRLTDGFITNSEYLRRYFIQKHRIDEHKVHAVHLGIDVTPYKTAKTRSAVQKMRRQLGLQRQHRVLLYAGRLMRVKGVHILLKAFQKVCDKDPKARLVIVGGTGYGSNRLNRYVKRLHELARPLRDKVKFVNFVPGAKMPLWYQIGDVVATPSVWQEPFCRVNLEAMASGKPVISTPRGGIGEVVTHQECGFLIPPSAWTKTLPEVWGLLWNVPNLRNDMGKKALLRAKKFSWHATAQGYLQVFAQVLKEKRAEAVVAEDQRGAGEKPIISWM